MSAAAWPAGRVLSWSGKWHVPRALGPAALPMGSQLVTLCGAYGYLQGQVPESSDRLQRIASGERGAPVCRRCARSEARSQGSCEGGDHRGADAALVAGEAGCSR